MLQKRVKMLRGKKIAIRKSRISHVIASISLVCFLLFSGLAETVAQLPGPTWMPGFPIVAGNQVILMWSPVPSAVKYVVYRGGKKETETNAFQAVLPLPVKEGDHEFYVVGVDASGAEGTAGPKYVYSVVKMEPPKSITALVREDGIFLRWDKSAGAMIYNVYRKSPKDKDFKLIGSTQELSLRDGAIEKDVDYLYHVTAKNVTGIESDKSEQVTAKLEEAAAAAPGGEEGFKLIPIRTELVWEAFDITKPFDVVFLGDLMVVAAPGQGNSAAYFVDMDGNVVAKFTDKEAQNPQYTGVSVSSDGTAYVVDRTNAILYELDSSGMPLRKVKLKAEGTKEQITPFDSIEIGGEIFVSDQRNNKILVYGKNGNFLRMFGEHGREEGQFISHPPPSSRRRGTTLRSSTAVTAVFSSTSLTRVVSSASSAREAVMWASSCGPPACLSFRITYISEIRSPDPSRNSTRRAHPSAPCRTSRVTARSRPSRRDST